VAATLLSQTDMDVAAVIIVLAALVADRFVARA
jgi:hypothetical protein